MFNLACILSLDIGASHATDAFIFCFELLTILKKSWRMDVWRCSIEEEVRESVVVEEVFPPAFTF